MLVITLISNVHIIKLLDSDNFVSKEATQIMSWVVGRSLVQSVQRRAYMSLRCSRSFSIVAPNKNTCRAGIVGVQLSSTFDSKDGHFNFFTVMGMSASALLLGQFVRRIFQNNCT